jgi:hypothetical protein
MPLVSGAGARTITWTTARQRSAGWPAALTGSSGVHLTIASGSARGLERTEHALDTRFSCANAGGQGV